MSLQKALVYIGHHVVEGWVTMVFPVGGYVLCVQEE